MKLVSLSLPLTLVYSNSCDSEFSSALQTTRKTFGATPCFTVDRGAVAPTPGIFHALDGSFEAEQVAEGAIAPVAGKFCVDNEHSALLERAQLSASASGKVESSLRGKKDFALKSLGPFPLVARDDLTVDLTEDAWSVGVSQGSLARTLQLDKVASYSWLGATEIDWAYQPDTTEPSPDAGNFEKYGGFLLKNRAGESQHVLEIDNFAAADDILITLEFSDPFWINKGDWNKCKNPAQVTVPSLKEQGAMEYCWATSQTKKQCETGCFLYKTQVEGEIQYQGFSVMKQYPLKELGPFHLHSRKDLVDDFQKERRNRWSLEGGASGRLAGTQTLDVDGSNFWQKASELDWAYQQQEGTTQAEGPFEKFGGFVLFDGDGGVMDILEIGGGGGDEVIMMSFGDPFWITRKQWNKCSNPAPITISALSDLGFEDYCWFTDDKVCERGCFYYKTVEGYMAFSTRGFALPSLGPFPLVIREDLKSKVLLEGDAWSLQGGAGSGQLGSTLGLTDEHEKRFWFGSDEVDWAFQNHEATEVVGNFEKYGGFLLKSNDSIQHVMEIDVFSSAPDMTLQFSEPFHITEQEWGLCKNPAPITIKALSDVGALEYCWEIGSFCPNGCFLYKTTNGYQAFAAKDFVLKTLGPFPLVDADPLSMDKSEFPTLIAGRELPLDTEAEREFWLGAASVTWMFPKGDLNRDSAIGGFEKYGGFMLKKEDNTVMRLLEIDTFASDPVLLLNFDPMHTSAAKFENCPNLRSVTIQSLIDAGAQEYCWEGSEALESCQFGCFLYMTSVGYQAFSITQ